MSKYQETVETGEAWRRAREINVTNLLNEVPAITFREEDVVVLSSGKRVSNMVGSVSEELTENNVDESFQLINPETGEPIADQFGSYQQVQVLVHSLYIHMAQKRDSVLIPTPSPTVSESSTPTPTPTASSGESPTPTATSSEAITPTPTPSVTSGAS